MRCRDDLIGPILRIALAILRSTLAMLWFAISPLANAVSVNDWLSEMHDGALHTTDMGECGLENGQVIEGCRLTFRTYGRLAPDLSNIVLMPGRLNGGRRRARHLQLSRPGWHCRYRRLLRDRRQCAGQWHLRSGISL